MQEHSVDPYEFSTEGDSLLFFVLFLCETSREIQLLTIFLGLVRIEVIDSLICFLRTHLQKRYVCFTDCATICSY